MGNSAAYRAEHLEATRAYMREYYLAHEGANRQRIVPGASRESKRCRKCGEVKMRDEFTVRRSGPRVGHLAAYCKPCASKQASAASQNDPTIYRRVQWRSKLKRLYGITVEDYNRMLAEQGGGCAMCGATDPNVGSRTYKKNVRTVFDVDHCHKTGKVRGLLCTRCNRLVGLANDDPDTAMRLIKYLS